MSNEIESRVVEMRFDNSHFESNVRTSMSTLEKLKSGLRLEGAAKAFEGIDSATKKIDFTILSKGVETVHAKFSALEVMAITALSNITNSAVNTGKRLVSAFTIEPIKTGLQEYETQINAVQTILANTESKGSTLQDVNRALNELNAYADKTIYNFTEMTRNIGTFTAAGLDLKTSTSAIQGIANVAAVSGSNAEQASRAMYQLSQALSSGTVKLMDWNSVVNAGMGGQVLQDALKETSRECVNVAKKVRAMSEAELEAYKASHGYTDDQIKSIKEYGYNVDYLIEKSGSFRESLSHGWITADVLSRTLNKFTKTGAVEYISEMTGASVTSVQELQNLGDTVGWDSEQVKNLALSIANGNKEMAENVISTGRMASSAEDAATKVKTFTQLMDTLKEAAQSGWTQTWQIIIGDFGEAKRLFTAVSDTLGGIINESSKARNELLSGGLSSGWKQLLSSGINDAEKFEEIIKNVAKTHNVDVDGMIDSEHDFQDTLKNGWVTVDILEESIKKYGEELEGLSIEELKAKGYTLEDAQAYAKLKEELDNGSLSLEEFQKKIARNSGRENIIDALSNSFNALVEIMKPITSAFKQIFPPATAEQLYRITEAILDFSKTLKPTTKQTAMLHQTFRGIFSAIDIVITIFKQLGGAVFDILGNFKGLGDSVLEVTANFGNWLYELRNTVKETDIFGGAVDIINKALQFIIDKFKNIKPVIADFIKGFSEVSGKIIPKAIGVFENLCSVVAKIGDVLKSAFGKIKDLGANIASSIDDMTAFDSFIKVLKNVWDFVKKACSGIVDAFSEIIRNGDLKAGIDTFNSGVIAAILLGVKKMLNIEDSFDGLTGGVFEQLKKTFEGLTGMFESVQKSLQAWQQNLNADTLKKIATAIGILAVSLIGLAMVKPEKLTNAIVAITTLFGELVGSMAILNKIGTFDKSFGTASNTMIKMSVAVLILSAALAKVGQLDWDQMIKGLIGVTILLGEVIGASILLSKYGGKVKSCGVQMILIAAAMEIFADVCSKFGNMSWETILKGVSGIGLVLLEFVGFQTLLSMIKPKKMMSSAISLVIIGAAMEIFADVCSKFGAMEWGDLGKAGVAMLGILALAAGFGLLAGLSKGMLGSSIALVIIAGGLEIMADVCSKFGAMDWGSLGKAGAAIAGILLLAAGFGLLAGLAPGLITSSIALLIMSGAMELMADVCSKFGAMDWEALGKSGVAIAGILALAIGFGVLAGFAPGMIAASAALLIMSAALSVLAPVMVLLGSMSWGSIGKGLVVVAGAFAVLGIAGLLLQPLIPAILGLSAAVALLGIGCLACGAGIALLATGLAALAVGGGAGIAALIAVIVELINLIPFIVQKVGEALVLLIQVIGESAPMLIDAIVQIGLALLQALTQLLPPLLDFVLFAILEVLRVIAENIQPIVERVVEIVVGIITALRNKIGDVVQVITDFVIAILKALADSSMQMAQAGVDLIINLIDGLANGIEENTPRIKEALVHLGEAILNAFCEFFGIHSPSTVFADVGGYLIQGLINGVGSFISSAVGKVRELATQMLNTIKSKISDFRAKGAELMTKLRDGIKSKVSAVKTAVTKLASDALSAVKGKIEDFKTAGKNMIDGLKNGIKNAASNAVEAAKGVAKDALEGAKKLLGIHSPSREFFKIGEFTVEGLANGIKQNTKLSDEAAINLAQGIIDSVESISKRMTYGSGAMKAYLKQYCKLTDSVEENDKIFKSASKSIESYAMSLYKESDQYEKDNKALAEHNAELSELYAQREELQKQLTEANDNYDMPMVEQLTKELERLDEKIDGTTNKIIEDSMAIEQHIADAFNKVRDNIKKSVEKSIDILSTNLETGVDLFNKFESTITSKSGDPFSEFSSESDITKNDLLKNMKSQADGIKQWENNLKRLEKEGISDELLEHLKGLGPDGASYVRMFIEMTDKELKEAEEYFKKTLTPVVTAEDVLGNLESQVEGVSKWKENLKKLTETGLDSGLVDELENMGVSGAKYVEAYLTMSKKQIARANELYAETGKMSADTFMENYVEQMSSTEQWSADIKKLVDRGFSEEIIKTIGDAGEKTGRKYIDALLNMSDEDVKEFNAKHAEALKLTDTTADEIIASYIKAGEESNKAFNNAATSTVSPSQENVTVNKTVMNTTVEETTKKETTEVVMDDTKNVVKETATEVSNAATEEISKSTTSWYNTAKGLVDAFAAGIRDNIAVAEGVARTLATTINTALNSTVDTNLSVRPVVTMDTESLTVMTNLNTTITNSVDSLTQVITGMETRIEASNNAVINAINGLRNDMSTLLSGDEQEIALYVDSKKLASSIAKPMNRELSILAKRGG